MSVKGEIRKLTEAAIRLSENPDYMLLIERSKESFKADEPSAIVAGFDTNQTMFFDGHKAVFRHFDKLIAGDYLEELPDEDQPTPREEFMQENQIE
jgi:hypothetical protein